MAIHLLVVDDNELVGESLRDYLQIVGYIVHYTTSGPAALQLAERFPIALVISDIMMPDMEGYTLCHELRRVYQIPVLLMSGFISEYDLKKMAVEGFDNFIHKPFSLDKLARKIKEILAEPHLQV